MTSYKRKDINKTTTHKQVDGEIKKKTRLMEINTAKLTDILKQHFIDKQNDTA